MGVGIQKVRYDQPKNPMWMDVVGSMIKGATGQIAMQQNKDNELTKGWNAMALPFAQQGQLGATPEGQQGDFNFGKGRQLSITSPQVDWGNLENKQDAIIKEQQASNPFEHMVMLGAQKAISDGLMGYGNKSGEEILQGALDLIQVYNKGGSNAFSGGATFAGKGTGTDQNPSVQALITKAKANGMSTSAIKWNLKKRGYKDIQSYNYGD